jgi:hypothetical protein
VAAIKGEELQLIGAKFNFGTQKGYPKSFSGTGISYTI